jgi:adenylate kinase family enzyme
MFCTRGWQPQSSNHDLGIELKRLRVDCCYNTGMKRIMILGPSNAGKSTLARALNVRLKIPTYHLDKEFWQENWTELPFAEMNVKHSKLISKDEWIIDGGWPQTRESRVKRAGTVIIMDIPRRVIIRRWLIRVWKNRGTVRDDMGGKNVERLNLAHFRGMLKHKNSLKREAWIKTIAPDIQIFVLHNKKEVESFISRF